MRHPAGVTAPARHWTGVAVLAVVLHALGANAATRAESTVEEDRVTRLADAAEPVTLSGWLHIVWNGEPRFFLVDDRGTATRLVIDEAVLKASWGPRALDQRRVTIEGRRVDDPSRAVRVLSIELDR